MRLIRGATTINLNSKEEIFKATEELLNEIFNNNKIAKDDVFAIFFTATDDIDKAYPAKKAREMGYSDIPMMCFQEMKVVGSLYKCIRVGVFINLDIKVNHIYLRGAKILRPDLGGPDNE